MGRRPVQRTNVPNGPAASSSAPVAKAPGMKYAEAAKLSDKNSRTIMKLHQLLEVIHQPDYETSDPDRVVERYAEKLKKRINRRLVKLARWSDSSIEERFNEFRRQFNPASGRMMGGFSVPHMNPPTSSGAAPFGSGSYGEYASSSMTRYPTAPSGTSSAPTHGSGGQPYYTQRALHNPPGHPQSSTHPQVAQLQSAVVQGVLFNKTLVAPPAAIPSGVAVSSTYQVNSQYTSTSAVEVSSSLPTHIVRQQQSLQEEIQNVHIQPPNNHHQGESESKGN